MGDEMSKEDFPREEFLYRTFSNAAFTSALLTGTSVLFGLIAVTWPASHEILDASVRIYDASIRGGALLIASASAGGAVNSALLSFRALTAELAERCVPIRPEATAATDELTAHPPSVQSLTQALKL
jgi:hypothetical protein